jgi:ribosome-associated protein
MKEIKIETEFIKLDQLLKFAGIIDTGGQSKLLINDGLVKINGELTKSRGKKIKKGDIVEIKDMESFIVV